MRLKMMSGNSVQQKRAGRYTKHHLGESIHDNTRVFLGWIVDPKEVEKLAISRRGLAKDMVGMHFQKQLAVDSQGERDH